MRYDVLIVGAGPAGLSAAIRLKQLAAQSGRELSVCVIEKGAEVGAHILSGNVLETRALDALIPDWKARGAPLTTPVTQDRLLFLTPSRAIPLPTPPSLQNHGNYIVSLGALCRWLAAQAEELGVEVYAGFAASEVLYEEGERGAVVGVATADMGVDKRGKPKDTFTRGIALRAKQTLFAEGARGSCSERLMARYGLREGCEPQTYGLGLKEVWTVPAEQHQPGLVVHTIGWPAPRDTWCGTFMYHLAEERKVLLGAVVGLDYPNPHLSPYHTFQQWKTHPAIRATLDGGQCVSYGARVINEGGYQAIPRLTFPGGLLIGCSAGFLNVPKIKGTHTAMQSGIVAAEQLMQAVQAADAGDEAMGLQGRELTGYQQAMEGSWVYDELRAVRNVHPSFNRMGGLYGFMLYSAVQSFLLRGREPWTFSNHLQDHQRTLPLSANPPPIQYPPADGRLTFELLSNLSRASVSHEEDQPSHLRIRPGMERVPVDVSLKRYGGPEQRFCPAKVYEYVGVEGEGAGVRLQINASNCVHCKSCAIKTPDLYIDWTVPEGGGGPN